MAKKGKTLLGLGIVGFSLYLLNKRSNAQNKQSTQYDESLNVERQMCNQKLELITETKIYAPVQTYTNVKSLDENSQGSIQHEMIDESHVYNEKFKSVFSARWYELNTVKYNMITYTIELYNNGAINQDTYMKLNNDFNLLRYSEHLYNDISNYLTNALQNSYISTRLMENNTQINSLMADMFQTFKGMMDNYISSGGVSFYA